MRMALHALWAPIIAIVLDATNHTAPVNENMPPFITLRLTCRQAR